MIGNFDEIKSQLRELAEVINLFKSEAVQLRLIELVLSPAEVRSNGGRRGTRMLGRRHGSLGRKTNKGSTPSETQVARAKTGGRKGKGGKAMLDRLIGEGFFKKPKTIKQVVEHCDHNLALKYDQQDFSGALARLTRDGELNRKKNAEKQYEYTQA